MLEKFFVEVTYLVYMALFIVFAMLGVGAFFLFLMFLKDNLGLEWLVGVSVFAGTALAARLLRR